MLGSTIGSDLLYVASIYIVDTMEECPVKAVGSPETPDGTPSNSLAIAYFDLEAWFLPPRCDVIMV